MSTTSEKLTRLKHLSALATRTKSELNALDAKIQEIVTVGGQPNVIEEIQVNGVKQAVADKKVNLVIATKVSELTNDANYQSNTEVASAISAAVEALKIGDYAKAADLIAAVERIAGIEADYLKAADKTELEGKITAEANRAAGVEGGFETRIAGIEADYLKAADKTELQGNIDTLTGVVNTLAEGVDAEKVDGVKDLIAYVEEHGPEVAGMKEDIEDNATAISGLDGRMGTAEGNITALQGAVATKAEIAYVDGAIEALKIGDYAKAADLTALAARVKAVEDDYLKAADKTALEQSIAGVDAKFAGYYTKGEVDSAVGAVDAKFAGYTNTEGMNAAIGAVDAKFANYSTTAQMNSAIGVVDAKFANYTNTTDMNAAIKAVDDKFAGYYTSAQIDAMIATDEEVTAALNTVFGAQA